MNWGEAFAVKVEIESTGSAYVCKENALASGIGFGIVRLGTLGYGTHHTEGKCFVDEVCYAPCLA